MLKITPTNINKSRRRQLSSSASLLERRDKLKAQFSNIPSWQELAPEKREKIFATSQSRKEFVQQYINLALLEKFLRDIGFLDRGQSIDWLGKVFRVYSNGNHLNKSLFSPAEIPMALDFWNSAVPSTGRSIIQDLVK